MLIGHAGHTRVIERIVAIPLLIVAIRILIPLPSVVYTNVGVKVLAAALLVWPSIWLLATKHLVSRKKALLGVFVTYVYSGVLGAVVDPTRFSSSGAWLALAAITGYLYLVTAWEVKWTRGSSQSSPVDPPPLDTS